MARQREHQVPHGFTLVELLVVIAVIGLLMGLLVPALASARQSARLAVSLSNMRQITMAAVSYSHNYGDDWPVIPLIEPAPNAQGGPVPFNSWNWGGKTSDEYWKSHGPINYISIGKRVLNPWVYPDVDLFDKLNFQGAVKKRMELEIFRCPSDSATYQRDFWSTHTRDTTISSYDDVGTSYHLNVKWWYASKRSGESEPARWRRTKPMFRRGGLGGPAMFVWCYDQIMDVVTNLESVSLEGEHGGLNRAKAAFLDGHVVYAHAQPGAPVTNDYWLFLE